MPIRYHEHVSIADKPEAVHLQGSEKKYKSCAAARLSVIATEKECKEAAKSLEYIFEGITDWSGDQIANCMVVDGDEVYFTARKGQQTYGCDWSEADCICLEGVLQSYFACFLGLPLFL